MKKILIIRFSSIGDIVLTSPVIRAVRNKYSESHISMLIKEEFAPLIKDCPYLDDVIILKKNERISGLVNRLKDNKYDIIIDIHHNIRSLYLDYTLSVKKRLIYKKNILKRWLLLNLHINLLNRNSSVIESYFEALKPLDIENDNKGLEIWINKYDEEKAEDFFKKYINSNNLLIGLAPFAHWETKCWPLEYYLKLMSNLSLKIDCRFIIFGGPGEDKKLENMFEKLPNKPIIAIGRLNLMSQAALITKCQYFVGNDTGLMHVADAANIPLITFMGPTVKEFGFSPLGKNSIVLSRDMKCRPCSLHGSNRCPNGTLECLASIIPDEVVNRILDKLELN